MQDLIAYLPGFARGLGVTLGIGGASILVMLITGWLFHIARHASNRRLSAAVTFVIEFLRGNDAVVLLFWVFFAVPLLPGGFQPTGAATAISVLGLTGGAYAAEVFRGAMKAIPNGQSDAVVSLGFGFFRSELRIFFPQMVPLAMPGLSSMAVEVFKWSAAASLVTVADLLYWANTARSQIGHSVLIFGSAIVIYYLLGRCITLIFEAAGKSFAKHEHLDATDRAAGRRRRAERPVDVGLPVMIAGRG